MHDVGVSGAYLRLFLAFIYLRIGVFWLTLTLGCMTGLYLEVFLLFGI